jgi:hypothetical protein
MGWVPGGQCRRRLRGFSWCRTLLRRWLLWLSGCRLQILELLYCDISSPFPILFLYISLLYLKSSLLHPQRSVSLCNSSSSDPSLHPPLVIHSIVVSVTRRSMLYSSKHLNDDNQRGQIVDIDEETDLLRAEVLLLSWSFYYTEAGAM